LKCPAGAGNVEEWFFAWTSQLTSRFDNIPKLVHVDLPDFPSGSFHALDFPFGWFGWHGCSFPQS
jgi:hypothetical protein